MPTVSGYVVGIKDKEDRSGNDYQGVTLKVNGAPHWFANYDEPCRRGDEITVEAKTTSPGRNMTFLNKARLLTRTTPAPTPDGMADPRPTRRRAEPPPTREIPMEDEEVIHRVSENDAAIGTIDDLAEGNDPTRFAGTISFRPGTTKAQVETILRAMSGVIDGSDVREYNPKSGSPVFYIP